MIYRLNKREKQRDNIIFGEHNTRAYTGGIRRFENLPLGKLEELINSNFIDTRDRQNAAPTIKDIYEFMKKYPAYTAHGYAVTIKRDDYRVSLEGVSKERGADSPQELADFTELFKFADEFSTSPMYCWFD